MSNTVKKLKEELEAARLDTEIMRKAVAQSVGYFMSEDGTKITVRIVKQMYFPEVTEYIRYDCTQDHLQSLMRMLIEKDKRINVLNDDCQGLEHQIYEQEREIRRLNKMIDGMKETRQ